MAMPYYVGGSLFMTALILICLGLIFYTQEKISFKDNKVNVFYLFLFAYSSLSILLSYAHEETTDFMFIQYGNFLRLILILLVLGFCNIDNSIYLKGIRYGILIGALSIMIFGILKIDVVLLSKDISSDYQTRFSGFYLNANYAGTVVAIGLNMLKEKKEKITLIETIIYYTAIFFTFSFTAILITLIGLYKKNKVLFIIIPIASLTYLVTFWETFNFSQSRYKKLAYLNEYLNGNVTLDKVFTGRIELWKEGIEAIVSKPIFGNGFGYMSSSIKTLDDVGIHNSYFEILGDFGLVIGVLIIFSLLRVINLKSIVGLSIFVALITGHGLLYTIPIYLYILIGQNKNKKMLT
ncbi:O-antigen ligase family protein [Tenacibaculum aiptasiae]|uniref:O-antigen ligase family protein n=1 Tax=Tenacibaculum aiptasiae TaxID=426481 RepID=A0A7J5A6Y8_9FLAO|nr:O-antigen ligase family protein [Tenacibaculum aiptasiae]KAB1153277.1 O-antigen ligase family protein [Tenacibaculum aiptasiae]